MASPSASPASAGDAFPTESQFTPAQSVHQTSTTSQNEEKATNTTPAATQPKKPVDDDEDDDDSDFDELDEVLDDFKPNLQPPSDTPAPQPPTGAPGAPEDRDEFAFMSQLEKDMAMMMGQAAQQTGASDPEGFENTINQGADAFTKQLEESGIPPGDFLKQLLADVMAEEEEGEKGEKPASAPAPAPAPAPASRPISAGAAAAAVAAAAPNNEAGSESFNDAINRTINRMQESGDKATAAASEDNSDDIIAQLMKALEVGGAGDGTGDEGDLTKIFMGMMEQLSNKDMLYEPMKELDTKFGPWIQKHSGKGDVPQADMERYEKQAGLVSQIVAKFEEKGYTDEDSKCREYVWEKMQAMQAAGNPPDELVTNPWMDDLKDAGAGIGAGAGGVPDCPQQ